MILLTEGEVLEKICSLTAPEYQETLLTQLADLPPSGGQQLPTQGAPAAQSTLRQQKPTPEERLPAKVSYPPVIGKMLQMEHPVAMSFNLPNEGTYRRIDNHLGVQGLTLRAVSYHIFYFYNRTICWLLTLE